MIRRSGWYCRIILSFIFVFLVALQPSTWASRLFDNASSEYLTTGSPPVTGYPYSVSVWFYTDDDTFNDFCMLQIQDKDVADEYHRFGASSAVSHAVQIVVQTTGDNKKATTANLYTVNTWHHYFAVGASATDRTVWLDADDANKGTSTSDNTPLDIDSMDVAREGDSSPSDHWSGRLAEIAVWNAALGLPEATMLSLGLSPLQVRPDALVYYLPAVRDNDNDIVGGVVMTAVNTPSIATHVSVFNPSMAFIITAPTAAAPSATPERMKMGVGTRIIEGLEWKRRAYPCGETYCY